MGQMSSLSIQRMVKASLRWGTFRTEICQWPTVPAIDGVPSFRVREYCLMFKAVQDSGCVIVIWFDDWRKNFGTG